MLDEISLNKCYFDAHVGVLSDERSHSQPIIVDITVFTDISLAAASDAIEDTLDYSYLHAVIEEVIKEREYNLIETIAEVIAARVEERFRVDKVRVKITKPGALTGKNVGSSCVEIFRPR